MPSYRPPRGVPARGMPMDDARDPNDQNPGTPRPEAPADRSAGLEAELAAALDDLRQVNDKLLRERADLENLKKRAARERAGRDPVRERGVCSATCCPSSTTSSGRCGRPAAAATASPLVEGVALVLKSASRHAASVTGSSGSTAAGHPVRPGPTRPSPTSRARRTRPTPSSRSTRPGYRLHDRLLRPALVTVSKGRPGPENLANARGR